jgi:hypothetical protein
MITDSEPCLSGESKLINCLISTEMLRAILILKCLLAASSRIASPDPRFVHANSVQTVVIFLDRKY